jgi:hypothetical protein
VGRSRKRERLARKGGTSPAGALPAGTRAAGTAGRAPGGQPSPGTAAGGDRPLHDPQWRRAERRRIARQTRLPDPFRSWGDRSRAHAAAVVVAQMVLVVVLTLTLMRVTTGTWLPRYAAVAALAVALVVQAVCRRINQRADARAG